MSESTAVIRDRLIATFEGMLQSIIDATPKVITGIVLIVLALVVAKVTEKLLRLILSRLRVDALMERLGLDQILGRLGISQPASAFLPRVFYFLLLFLFVRTAADALGLEPVSQAIGSLLAYVPNLIAAFLLLLFGALGSQFAGTAVRRAAEGAGLEFGRSLGSMVSGLILFVVGITALSQLKIDTDTVRLVTTGLLLAMALALGLSFGLGSRQVAQNVLAGFYIRKTFRTGDELEIAGERGTLKAVTPTFTLLEREGETVSVANARFLDEVASSRP